MDIKQVKKYSSAVFVGDFCVSGEDCETDLVNRMFDPWSALQEAFAPNAFIVGNLECPFTDVDKGLPYKWANLKASPRLHWVLDGLGVAILGNNHIEDFGNQGVKDTLALLDSKGILGVGYGERIDEAVQPVFANLDGKKLGIVSLCCPTTNGENLATHLKPGVAPLGMATLKQAVDGARGRCDALIAYLHWGCEWVHDPAPDQLRLARHAIDCGVDAVIGCHSHTIQSYEQYRGRWIFYGLGNYLFKAGYAQTICENGEIKRIPLTMKPANQESLAVSFKIVPDSGEGGLALVKVQLMRFGDDLKPRLKEISELSFDIAAANERLRAYSARNDCRLHDRSEPVLSSQLRNGILAHRYAEESISRPPSNMLLPMAGEVIRKVTGISKRVSNRVQRGVLESKITRKWLQDKRCLPLTADHRELYNIIHRLCWRELGEFPNLINCRDFNDKIQWLKLFDQSEEIVRCSDKVLVRNYIRERVGEQHLINLYQVHNHFSQIDFDALPNAFVIKTNHDSGTVILVRDKSKLDRKAAEQQIEEALKQPYGWENGEWAYSFVTPKVLVEEFIEPENKMPPPDYKFYCVNGMVKFCHYIYDRGFDTKEQTIDPAGNDLATDLYPSFKLGTGFIKPSVWGEMIGVAERLGKGFKCVRVDLFCSNEHIYAGEMTFWPMAGHYKGEGQKTLGKYLDFDRETYKPFILSKLGKISVSFQYAHC